MIFSLLEAGRNYCRRSLGEIDRMRSLRLFIVLAVAALTSVFAIGSAQAEETFTFRIKSDYQYKVQVAFFSQSRNFGSCPEAWCS